jgi:hypothetical protein
MATWKRINRSMRTRRAEKLRKEAGEPITLTNSNIQGVIDQMTEQIRRGSIVSARQLDGAIFNTYFQDKKSKPRVRTLK